MSGKRWRKWLGLAVLALVFLGIPLAFGISNLFLMSSKGRSFVAGRIQRAIQLDTSVQGGSWSPWNGFTVYGLLIEQPAALRKSVAAPLLAVESIRIHPDWSALPKKRLVIRGVEIRKPDLAIPIELLSQIPGAPVEPNVAVKPPDLAAVEPPPAAPETTPPAPPTQVPPADPALAAKPEVAAPEAPAAVTDPTVWVTFSDARFRIVSTISNEPLYHISSINGGLPIGGKSAGSELVLDGIEVCGNAIPGAVKIPVKWQAPALSFGVFDAGAFGIGCKLEAKVGLTPGIPFLIGGVVPKQEGKQIALSEALRAKVGSIAGQGRFHGYALAPGSWQGQGVVQALGVDAEFANSKASFQHGQGIVMFQQGVLRCIDARLIGDEISCLGNGAVLNDGRFAGHLRIVAAPENLGMIAGHIQTDSPARFTPLSTPQRAALDMAVFGFPGKVFFQSNPTAKPVLIR